MIKGRLNYDEESRREVIILRKLAKTAIVAQMLLIIIGFALVPAYAATGDVLATINPALYTGNGRAMAFDGVDKLYYTIYDGSGNIYEVKTDGTGNAITTNIGWQAGALAWDAGRGGLWVGRYDGNPDNIWFLTIPGLVLTYKFSLTGMANYVPTPHVAEVNHIDGLAYDPVTDSLWLSEDWAHRIHLSTPAGAQVTYFDTDDGAGGYWDNGGIGIDLNGHLWLGQPGDVPHQMIAGDQIYKYRQDGVYLGIVFNPATQLVVNSWRPEGIAFDSVTFAGAGKWAIWVMRNGGDAPQIAAFEIPVDEPPFFVIPEVPFGTIMSIGAMIIALTAYVAVPRLGRKH